MTTTSPGSTELRELVRAHGADLHRLATMLAGDEGSATVLVARTLADRDPAAAVSPDRLRTDLVRRYLRSAPRQPEGVGATVGATNGDAGDALRSLRPRARAAAALRLVEGWDAERTAEAVGVSRSKVDTMVPSVPGLDVALVAVADQHALSGPDLEGSVLDATPEGGPLRPRWRGRGALIAALLSAALVVAVLQDAGRGDEGTEDGEGDPATLAQIGETDLTDAGWVLRDDGDPPRSVNGVHLQETVTLDKGRRSASVDLPPAPESVFAAFGVLWCEMPPAEDDHLVVPTGTLTVDDVQITLPCAGRTGSPPVTQVVPLPPSGQGLLELSGDMPGGGVATLGIYQETDSDLVPAARGTLTQGPPVEDGAVELDLSAGGTGTFYGWRASQPVSITHGSTIRVWAGRTGSISVVVDGVPATDDGDVAAWMTLLTSYLDEPVDDGPIAMPDLREYADWSTQEVDLRDGRWLVAAPDTVRTFTVPSQVAPAPGDARTVTVEVITENVEDHLQVALTDALPARVDTAPVTALAAPDVPLFTTGHRLVGQWEVPADGHARELVLDGAAGLPEEMVILATRAADPATWALWGEGQITRGAEVGPLWLQTDLETALQELRQPHFALLPTGPGPVTVAAPPAPGHPATTIVGYTPVPYEEFDFSSAAIPADVWPAGSPPPDTHLGADLGTYETVGTIEAPDLQEGTVTVDLAPDGEVVAQITTAGRGRIRFEVDGHPADGLWGTDGWWSSWTDQPVTSLVTVANSVSPPRTDPELTVVVEGYEDFSLRLLTGDPSRGFR
ncbi:hypothetical protein [Ornithinimicrobium sufpigmenti]|uniref:hypothetical protein n=1 Tax=Ornithinimicrobium sufpigmenti TaxID=2508882 RepID=UPI001035D7BF|nr:MULTISPECIES: hypothetical protein [unclassified Ornithinimicrobium]